MAPRITRPCEGGVCWSWDPVLLTRADLTYDTLSITPDRYRALLNRISAPVTLVYGRAGDPHLARMREALPAAVVRVVPGGHNLHLDAPAAVAEVIAGSAGSAGIVPATEPRRA
jgi:pimeloyl-ACP methyl ester carboxylesterase